MANTTIYPYGQGGQTPSGIGLNAGTFADAYDLARANNYIFPWMLIDEDEEGNPIKKMIWHTGNGKFIDAIGAEITGEKNGITINVSAPCRIILNGKTFSLLTGETNISFSEIGASYAPEPSFLMPESDDSAKSLVESIDFGGFDIIGRDAGWYPVDGMMNGFANLTRIERLSIAVNNPYSYRTNTSIATYSGGDANLEYISLAGTKTASFTESCRNRPKLRKADFSKMFFTLSSIYNTFSECTKLEEVDVSGWNTSNTTNFGKFLYYCSSLKKFTIGNFSNAAMTSKEYAFGGISDCVLICTTSTPPVLKNCAFDGDTALDEYSNTYDWVAGHFSAIYVPSDAVDAYKENTYIENGTVGNTGWSKYADIIHPITEYNG